MPSARLKRIQIRNRMTVDDMRSAIRMTRGDRKKLASCPRCRSRRVTLSLADDALRCDACGMVWRD
jgi:hypothetical protein